MKYGCIGNPLKHSFSREVHRALGNDAYELLELSEDEVLPFLAKRDFEAINVTIPYKEKVIAGLDGIDDAARAIGAVNTIKRKGDKLFGCNTDFSGMKRLLAFAEITLKDKKIAILGSGGTSKTARAVSLDAGAKEILRVSRTAKEDAIDYETLQKKHGDVDILINCTPVGMFPNAENAPVDLAHFPNLSGVVDAVYNPLKTELILSAEARGIPAAGGLYMLVAQGVRAAEIFFEKDFPEETYTTVYNSVLSEKRNVVLCGMPTAGKTSTGRALSALSGRKFFDVDELVAEKHGEIAKIIRREGEAAFRAYEKRAIEELSSETGAVIATGGGSILDPENVRRLKRNGTFVFLNRPLESLVSDGSRPLSDTEEKLSALFRERRPIYARVSDVTIAPLSSPEETAAYIFHKIIGGVSNE